MSPGRLTTWVTLTLAVVTATLVTTWMPAHAEVPARAAGTTALVQAVCDPAYPTLCVPEGGPDLDCADVAQDNFPVTGPDSQRFDADHDGIGCENSDSTGAAAPRDPAGANNAGDSAAGRAASGTEDGKLPVTGDSSRWVATLGIFLVLIGGILVTMSRRRPRAQ